MPVKKRHVVITTEHRGVFFGVLPATADDTAKTLTLTDVQMCVSWSASIRGVLGLAVTGPDRTCRISPAVPKMTLQSVTSVMDATDEAVTAWAARPWS